MKKRIIGIDVARAMAVIGMIIVNFKVVFGASGDGWLQSFAHLLEGKAAATFVVLAGIGLALMTNSAIRNKDKEKLKLARKKIVKRALFLFIIGLSYIWIWPADILHFYGVYMLICLFFLTRTTKQILIGLTVLIFIYPILILFIDYEVGWNFDTLEYSDFWTLSGFLRNLFFNGFHPVIPWSAFMLFGLWFGKQDLRNDQFIMKSLKVSSFVFIAVQLVSFAVVSWLSKWDSDLAGTLIVFFETSPMPPMPIYLLSGISVSVALISACILIAKRLADNRIIVALNKTGQLALTFYVAHVVIGMGIMEEFGTISLGAYSIEFSIVYALSFSLLCILFAEVWLRYYKAGPLEWIMRKLTN